MTTVKAAAIYARISSDSEGTGLGVARQIEDCRALADRLGWPVAEVYEDNDFSAYSGKKRPAYARMLEDLQDRRRDAVLVYHVDRLTRRPIELEEFVQALDIARVRHVRFVAGDSDIMTGDGLMVVRMLAAMAANESATKSRRLTRKYQQLAESGAPKLNGRRPFGFEKDRMTIRESEAQVIREVAARMLAGESQRSLCAWLDDQGIRTSFDGRWRTPTLRAVVTSARVAGLREYRGQVIGPALWDAIISPDEREALLALMKQKHQEGRRAPRRYLLTGLLRCGRCGGRLFSAARAHRRRYVCMSGPDHGGCGRLTVVSEPLEQLIADAVLMRLSGPNVTDALAGRATSTREARALADQVNSDKAQLDELASLYAAKLITAAEWLTARKDIEARLRDAQRALTRLSGSAALDSLLSEGTDVAQRWAGLNLDRQHAIVAAVLDYATINPSAHSPVFEPDRVHPVWKV